MTSSIRSLELLPTVSLEHILDYLPIETILFSVRYVCRNFYLLTNAYNRYTLDCQAMIKTDFHSICRRMYLNQINSMVLSHGDQTPGQIQLFLSLYSLDQFGSLRSVTLLQIEECQLEVILKQLNTVPLLSSVTITFDQSSLLAASTLKLLAIMMRKDSLRQLALTLPEDSIDELEWPIESFIQHLQLITTISFEKFSTVLQHSPKLAKLVVKDCFVYDKIRLSSYSQLISLTLQDCESAIDRIEFLLSHTPSLVYLKILSESIDLSDGYFWEAIIQEKLPQLVDFRFACQRTIGVRNPYVNLPTLIAPFKTPFWLEIKRWFITVLVMEDTGIAYFYTLPDCPKKIYFHLNENKTSLSNAPLTNSKLFTSHNIHEMDVDVNPIQRGLIAQVNVHHVFAMHSTGT